MTLERFILGSVVTLALIGCSGSASPAKDADTRKRVEEIALQELENWVQQATVDADQIRGATVSEVRRTDAGYHVTLSKDSSALDAAGNHQPEGMHIAYFHVYLDENLVVTDTKRGPDEIS